MEPIDVLARVLQDKECDAILHESLTKALKENPVDFYKDFVAPRSSKLLTVLQQINVVELTPAQEVAKMNERTSPQEQHKAIEQDETKTT